MVFYLKEEELRELSIEALSAEAREVDSSGTLASAESVAERLKKNAETSTSIPNKQNQVGVKCTSNAG